MLQKHGHLNIEAYTGVDWAGNPNDRDLHRVILLLWEVTWRHGGVISRKWLLFQVLRLNFRKLPKV